MSIIPLQERYFEMIDQVMYVFERGLLSQGKK
jgi:hypothetical protein